MSWNIARTLPAIGLTALLASVCPAQSLRDCADARRILIGAAVRPQLFSESLYTLGREFNMVEPEDAMKWWVLRPGPASFDFTQADLVVAFAESHRMKVRGHTLVWGWSNPTWLNIDSFTAEELNALL